MFQPFKQASRKFTSTSLTLICMLVALSLSQDWQPRKLAAILPHSNPLATPTPPTPLLDLTVPGMEFPNMTLIGEKFCYTARITNLTGAPVGYGPYVQIILPDGMVVENAGLPGVCNTGNCNETSFYQINFQGPLTTDPYTGESAPPGTKIFIIQAPIGSLYAGEPGIDLKICVRVTDDTSILPLDVPVNVCQRAVFQFGGSATGTTPIKGPQQCPPLMPVVAKITKRALNYTSDKKSPDPTVEIPTGSCNPITFELIANIADSKTLDQISIEDQLPTGMTLVNNSVTVLNATGVVNKSCTNYSSNFVCVKVDHEQGAPGVAPAEFESRDIVVQFQAYANNNVLSTNSCASAQLLNTASLDAFYQGNAILQQTDDLLIEVERVTLQKTAAGPNAPLDPLHVVPGDMVNYSLNFQVSQGTTISNAVITDRLPNGITLVGTPMIFCGEISTPVVPTQIPHPEDGSIELRFNLGTVSGCTSCSLGYKGMVAQTYNAPLAGQPVLASDSLIPVCSGSATPPPINCTTITYNIPNVLASCSDDTYAGVVVKPVQIEKSLVTPEPSGGFQPGDTVTFKLKMCIPSGDTKSIMFKDFLPSPIFNASSVFNVSLVQSNYAGGTFTTMPNAADNSIKFTINPTLITGPTQLVCFEITFSVIVTTNPFVDDLYLTNLFQSQTTNTAGQVEGHLTGVIVHVRAPKLKLTKGVLSSDNPNAVIDPSPSPTPTPTPVNGNITGGADANDTITYYLTVKNEGGAPAYAVKITDMLPAGMLLKTPLVMPVGSAPTPAASCSPSTCPLPTMPIPAGTNLILEFGTNVLPAGQSWVVQIQLMIPAAGMPCQILTNNASLIWSSDCQLEAPGQCIPAPAFAPVSDAATVTTSGPTIIKTITDTNQPHTTGHNVTIGEIVDYEFKVRIPEGKFTAPTSGPLLIKDVLQGMAVVSSTVCFKVSGTSLKVNGVTFGNGVQVGCTNLGNQGQEIPSGFLSLENPNTNNAPVFLVFNYQAVVLNLTANVQGAPPLQNTVLFDSAECDATAQGPPLTIVEPKLQITKAAFNPATGLPITTADAGDVIEWRITITNSSPSTANAFDVQLNDVIPAGQSYVNGSLMTSGLLPVPFGGGTGNSPITATWASFPLNSSSTIKFQTTVPNTVAPCQTITNQASLAWTSIPGTATNLSTLNTTTDCERTGNPANCGNLNNYSATAMATVTVPGPKITKSFVTSLTDTVDPNVTIGEGVDYLLRIELPEGMTPSLIVKDVIPPGMSVSSINGKAAGFGGIPLGTIPNPSITPLTVACPNTGGATVTLTYGAITVPAAPNNFFVIRISAMVCDVMSNMGMPQNQTMLPNSATVQSGTAQMPTCFATSNTVTLKVVEPKLKITKNFDPNTVKEGDMVTINLTVMNIGLSTAYNVIIEDPLPLWLFDNASIVACGTTPAGFTLTKPVVGTNSVVTFTGGNILTGQTLNFCFKGTVKRRCQMDMFNNVAKIKQAWTLPPPGCAPDCTRPTAPADNIQGRDESVGAAVGEAKLIITPALDCNCFGFADATGVIRPPAYNNMVEWLKFDEAIGDTANDSSTFNNDGTLMPSAPNGPQHVAGLVNNALQFDGVDDSVLVPDNASLDFGTGNFAMDAWINPDPISVSATSGNRTILDKRHFSITLFPFSINFTGYQLFLSNGRLALQLTDGNASFDFISTATIPANTWTHVAAVVFRTSTSSSVIFYVDGIGLPAITTNTVNGSVSNSSALYLGRSVPLGGNYFTGKIDEVELFNIAPEHVFPGIANAGKFGKCLPAPPVECCGAKPQFRNGNYPTFNGQVALVTCYANDGTDPVMAAIDLQNQAAAEASLLDMNWSSTTTPQTAFYHPIGWIRNVMGTVFGLTLDNTGNVYVAASSVYQRVPTANIQVTLRSYRGTAGPGGVYKVDHLSANPTPFVTTLQGTVYVPGNQLPNFDPLGVGAAGTETMAPGLGNLAFDCARNLLFVSNFEDGRIYRIDATGATGTVLDFWDHGANLSPAVPDDTAPGMTAPNRRVWAVKTYNNRLYYSVWKTDSNKQTLNQHNEIWSVGLNIAGVFVGPPQLEISVPYLTGKNYSSPVSDISFMPNGSMLLAERSMDGDPNVQAHQARVLEYVFSGSAWLLSTKVYEVGRGPSAPAAGINAAGGVDFDHASNGRVWATGDALHFAGGDYIYGLQGMPAGGTAGLNTMKSLLIDVDENLAGGGVSKFQIGDVQIPCPTNPCVGVTINITSPAMLPVATAGQNYTSPQFTATGGTPGYMFSASDLPMGLTMSMNGVISGISMQTGTFTIKVTAKDANGCMEIRNYDLTIICATNIAITPATLPNSVLGMAYSQQLTATGGCGTFTYSQVGGILPPGLTLSPTGILSGTPTACGTYDFVIKATDKCGCMTTRPYTLTIEGQQTAIAGLFNTGVNNNNMLLAIGATDTHYGLVLPDNNPGTAVALSPTLLGVPWVPNSSVSQWIGPANAVPNSNYSFTTSFQLPASCTQLSAVISGRWAVDNTATMFLNGVEVASLPGDDTTLTNFTQFHPFSITSNFQPGMNTLTIAVHNGTSAMGLRIEWAGSYKCCPCQLAIGPELLPGGTAGTGYLQALQPYGGIPPYTFTLQSGNLPPGVTFNNGVLSGTPTTPGSYMFTVKLTDATGCMTTRSYTVIIGCQLITLTPETLRAGIAGVAYNQTLTQTGGTGAVTYSRIGGLLPPGLTLSNTGVLSGTPTTSGTFSFTLKATDANNCAVTRVYTLEIICRTIMVNPSTLSNGSVGAVYNQTLTATGSATPYIFTRISGLLPPGLTLSSSGALSGTPTAGGWYDFTIKATDTNGCAGTQSYTITICDTIVISPATLPNGFVGTAYNQTLTQPDILLGTSWSVSGGGLPNGLSLNATTGAITGTPTSAGSFGFTVTATDANGCTGTRAYTVLVNSNGLQFYPLPAPVRALETRAPYTGCVNPGAPINAHTSFTLAVRTGCTGIPANAAAVTGNITVVPGATGGYLTLFSSNATQPIVANSNFKPGQVTNNVFTTGLGTGDGAFKIFASATTEVIVDITGYYAPPAANGLYFHPLSAPVRLLETRAGLSVGCIKPGAPLTGGQDFAVQGRAPVAAPCNVIPAAAQVLVGNATSVVPAGAGFLTLFPSDAARPLIASSNYAGADVINGPFAVKLGADGKFKVYTHQTTELVIDILGYYSSEATDANGTGLLFNPLPSPVRLLETRPDFPGFPLTGCTRTNTPIAGNLNMATHTQMAANFCGLPATAQAVVGNVSVVNTSGAGFLTLFPANLGTAPLVATSNYPVPASFGYNRHYIVGLSPADGKFKVLTNFTTDLILDASGYFAP